MGPPSLLEVTSFLGAGLGDLPLASHHVTGAPISSLHSPSNYSRPFKATWPRATRRSAARRSPHTCPRAGGRWPLALHRAARHTPACLRAARCAPARAPLDAGRSLPRTRVIKRIVEVFHGRVGRGLEVGNVAERREHPFLGGQAPHPRRLREAALQLARLANRVPPAQGRAQDMRYGYSKF